MPRELGGAEAGIEDALAVFEELAYADGSTGWSAMANATSSAFAAIYTSDEAAKTMFNADGRGIHAGMLGPVGTARVDDDGFVVNGRYSVRLRVRARDLVRRGHARGRRRRANR